MNQQITREIPCWGWLHHPWYVGFHGFFIRTAIIFFNDEIAKATGFSVFPATCWT